MSAGAGHEPLGIDVSRIGRLAAFTVGGFLLAVGASLVIWVVWHRSASDAPAPAHGASARAPIELDALRARQQQRLNTYGWVDREAGIARIPVQRAMVLLAAGAVSSDGERVRQDRDHPRNDTAKAMIEPEPAP